MVIYFIVIILWFIIWNKFHSGEKKEIQFMLILSIIILFMLMGFRSSIIGADTKAYCLRYVVDAEKKWSEIFCVPFSLGNSNYGFLAFNKLIGMIVQYIYPLYLVVVSGVISYALYKYMKVFSVNYLLSLIMLLALGFIFFFMSGIKQTLAISFILLAYIELYKEKRIKFLILVLLASMFHNTALIVLITLPIYRLRIKRLYYVILPLMVFLTLTFKSTISSKLQLFVSEGKYGIYGNGYIATNNLTGLYIQLVIIATALLLVGKKIKFDKKMQFFVSIYSIGIFFQALTPVIAEFFRISMYFSITGCVMIPYAIVNSRIKQKNWILFGMLSIFVIYFYISNYENRFMVPYKFFWQQ